MIYDQSTNKNDTELKSYCIPLGMCHGGWSSYYLCTTTLHFTNKYKRFEIKCEDLEIIDTCNIGLLYSNILSKIHSFEMSSILIPYMHCNVIFSVLYAISFFTFIRGYNYPWMIRVFTLTVAWRWQLTMDMAQVFLYWLATIFLGNFRTFRKENEFFVMQMTVLIK